MMDRYIVTPSLHGWYGGIATTDDDGTELVLDGALLSTLQEHLDRAHTMGEHGAWLRLSGRPEERIAV